MAGIKRVQTPVASEDYIPLPALGLWGNVQWIPFTANAVSVSAPVGPNCTCVQFKATADFYVANGDGSGNSPVADEASWELPAGWSTYHVRPGSRIAIRGMTIGGYVKILEAPGE